MRAHNQSHPEHDVSAHRLIGWEVDAAISKNNGMEHINAEAHLTQSHEKRHAEQLGNQAALQREDEKQDVEGDNRHAAILNPECGSRTDYRKNSRTSSGAR